MSDLFAHIAWATRLSMARPEEAESILVGAYEFVDSQVREGRFDRIDRMINLSWGGCSEVLLGILTITLPWKDHLPNRAYFRECVEAKLALEYGDERAQRIIKGL